MLDQRGATLFDALYAFFQEHQYRGELDGGVEGDRVWMKCTCGAAINRNADRDWRDGLNFDPVAVIVVDDGHRCRPKDRKRTSSSPIKPTANMSRGSASPT
jgi:hypothetical protein